MKEKYEKTEQSVESVLAAKIDVKGGRLTFGQRIELGRIFQEANSTDNNMASAFERVFECLHGYTPAVSDYRKLTGYWEEINRGLLFWFEQEKLLKYEPTPEEIQAGIRELCEKTGEMGTIKSLAKTYATDPDEILKWEYGKVFGILYTDMEESIYRRKFDKIIERKYKKKY